MDGLFSKIFLLLDIHTVLRDWDRHYDIRYLDLSLCL